MTPNMTRALLALVLTLAAATAAAGDRYDALYREAGAAYGVDWRLVKAVAIVESSENPKAENRRDPSIGLMQLHCAEDAQGRCTNRFDVEGWVGITRERLLDPRTNVRLGTQILAWNLRVFGFERGIAVYNSWAARHTPAGQAIPNQRYVDRVMGVYRKLFVVRAAGGRASNTGNASLQRSSRFSSQVIAPTGPRKGL